MQCNAMQHILDKLEKRDHFSEIYASGQKIATMTSFNLSQVFFFQSELCTVWRDVIDAIDE